MSKVLVVGATGFVGSHLVPHLEAAGHQVRCTSRSAKNRPGDWVTVDLDDPSTLGPALDGCDAAVFLVHRMADAGDLHEAERANAQSFREAAERAGLKRIVYLGGPTPAGKPSRHLQSRLTTGEVLRSGSISTIELRAAMIIGVGSESWTMCRDLACRLPVMVLPSWLGTRSQPVWIGDVVEALTVAVTLPLEESAWFGLPGPDVLSARDILMGIAAARGMRPVMIPVPLLTPKLSSYWLQGVTRADYQVARQLVDGLRSDLVMDEPGMWAHLPNHRRVGFDEATRRALADEPPLSHRRGRLWERAVQWVSRDA